MLERYFSPQSVLPSRSLHRLRMQLSLRQPSTRSSPCRQPDRRFTSAKILVESHSGYSPPSARLFDAPGNEVGTHGDGPIWSYQDGSSIQGVVQSKSPAPEPDSIPWLLLKAVNPQRSGILTTVSFIRRSDTKGGVVPATVCDLDHQGVLARIPYTATYTFYSAKP